MILENIFRAYDIRGIYGKDITEDIAEKIAEALAFFMNGNGKTVLIGRDVRLSGKSLSAAFARGLLSGGFNVEDIGVVTTPLLNFSSMYYHKNGGVMVTASHNPPEWNGFKILGEKGFISMGMGMEDLKDIALKGHFRKTIRGKLRENPHAISDYENYVVNTINLDRRLKVAADPGNGSCSLLIPKLFEKAGMDIVAINTVPDGTFPSHPPEPTEETLTDLKKLVIKERADFGVGFDGDGDRALFVDEKGRTVSSASFHVMLAKHYLRKQKGAAIVYEISCSMSIEETVKAQGGKPILSRVGHTYIVDKMQREKAAFGGETSGHFYFKEIYGFDDALYASLKIAEILSERGEKLSEIIDALPQYPRIPVKNYVCPDEIKFQIIEKLGKEFAETGYKTITLDGIKVVEEDGWFLVRPSNTQPMIRLTVEAKNEEALGRLADLADKKIKEKMKNYN